MNPISVIIPCYNQAQYLEECIESVYNQTVSPHEIIIINDGSTDNSQEIAERYMFTKFPGVESPVRVINQINKGLPSARNTGIMNATGTFIWPLDADDVMKENAVERMTQEMLKVNADVYAPSFEQFGIVESRVILQNFNMDDLKLANRIGYFSCMKRSVLLEVGGYSPKMRYGWEDYALWFDLFKRGKTLTVIPDILIRYRVKEHSMIHDANEHADELWAQIRKDNPQIFTK